MRRYPILFLGILMIISLQGLSIRASHTTVSDPVEPVALEEVLDSFTVQMNRGNQAGISIEHSPTASDQIPVCLYVGDLEISLRMNGIGQVRHIFASESSPPLFTIDLPAREIYTGEEHFPISILSQSPVRTRLRFMCPQNPSAFITFRISRTLGLAEICMNGTSLPLPRLNIEIKQIVSGQFELIFKDPYVTTYADFILESAAGKIYEKGGRQ